MIRLQVADRANLLIGELEAEIGPVSWRLNDIGRVQFSISRGDAKATEEMLRFGNRLLLQFDNGLPDWGGVIDPPRTWQEGRIACTAYSAEWILGYRQTDKGRYFDQDTVGTIFSRLIREANQESDLGLSLGYVWTGGIGHSPDYHFKNLLTIIQDSLCDRLSDCDFDVTADESGGRLAFAANLYERKGSDKSGKVALMEGHNLVKIKLAEQGPIVNWWDLAGEGTDWGDMRITSHSEDAASISEYGLRQDSAVYSDVSIQGTLDTHAANLLAEYKAPHNMLELEAIDLAPAEFAGYDVGDSLRLILYSYGFGGLDTPVRVLGREFNPKSGTCTLVVREE